MADLQLYDYQKESIKFMITHPRCINASDMGCGKTVEAIMALLYFDSSSILVFAPKVALGVWQREFKKWLNWDSTIYKGTITERNDILKKCAKDDRQILLANPYWVDEIRAFQGNWDSLVVDEVHLRGFGNYKSTRYKELDKFKSNQLYLLSGTLIRKGLEDLYSPFHLLYPKTFKSYWQFMYRHGLVFDGKFGKEIERYPKNPDGFKKNYLDKMITKVKLKDIAKFLPEKRRTIIPMELDKEQIKLYKQIDEDMMFIDKYGRIILASIPLVKHSQVNQMLYSPFALGIDKAGQTLNYAVDLCNQSFDSDKNIAIFMPFKKGLDDVVKYLYKKTNVDKIFSITSKSKEEAVDIAKQYNDFKGKKIIMITILSGIGFRISSADIGIFMGADYTPANNHQAESRLIKVGDKTQYKQFFYLLYPQIDTHENLINILDSKQEGVKITFND